MNAPSNAPKILVTNPIHAEVQARLQRVGIVEMNLDIEPWTQQQLVMRAKDADAIMGFMTDSVGAGLLAKAPRLRVLACALKGYDNFDVDACTQAGVWVSIVPDSLTEPTAELAVGLAISLARNMVSGDAQVRRGEFQGWRPRLYGTGLAGATVAIVGLGCVGQAIIARLAGFGCARFVGIDPVQKLPGLESLVLEEALTVADFVFVAAPLTTSSFHMVDARALAHCKPGHFIINVGRGSVVDEEAIAAALEAGSLGGYAADVFACEDWGLAQRPAVVPVRLCAQANTLLTPHLGSAVRDVRLAIEHRAADNIIAVLEGHEPADAINRPEFHRGCGDDPLPWNTSSGGYGLRR